MKFKNLSQLKKGIKVGDKLEIMYNAYKDCNIGSKRTVSKVQTNAVNTEKTDGGHSWIYFQKAKEMRFNEDNTIDFLASTEISRNGWLSEVLEKENKDYWLKIKLN